MTTLGEDVLDVGIHVMRKCRCTSGHCILQLDEKRAEGVWFLLLHDRLMILKEIDKLIHDKVEATEGDHHACVCQCS